MVEPAWSWVSGESPLAAASGRRSGRPERRSKTGIAGGDDVHEVSRGGRGNAQRAPTATLISRESRNCMRPSVVKTGPNRNHCNRAFSLQNRVHGFAGGKDSARRNGSGVGRGHQRPRRQAQRPVGPDVRLRELRHPGEHFCSLLVRERVEISPNTLREVVASRPCTPRRCRTRAAARPSRPPPRRTRRPRADPAGDPAAPARTSRARRDRAASAWPSSISARSGSSPTGSLGGSSHTATRSAAARAQHPAHLPQRRPRDRR